jgi:hypothetical protein
MATPTTLPAAFVAGAILTADQMNNLRGAFRVLQVVQGSTSTLASSSVTTYADTGLTATITPSATTNKILVVVMHNMCGKGNGNSQNGLNLKLFRGATDVKTLTNALGFTDSLLTNLFAAHAVVLDSPNTISATTYKTQFSNFQTAASVSVQTQSVESTITLLEISA